MRISPLVVFVLALGIGAGCVVRSTPPVGPPPAPQPMPEPMPAPAPAPPVWNSEGWTLLGEQVVHGARDRDRIVVGREEGRFTKVTVVVLDSDLELLDMDVTFGNGQPFSPRLAHFFREGSRTRVIDLPGDARAIRSIDFRYRNLAGGGRARVQVWAWRVDASAAPAPQPVPAPVPQPVPVPQPAPGWDSTGWTMLGEQVVHGGRDRDRIRVGRDEGTFRRLVLVVTDSDLELVELEIKFGRGQPFRPEVRHLFREGSRTRIIDLPGDARVIKWIELRYRNLPGGGRARVQVWAQ